MCKCIGRHFNVVCCIVFTVMYNTFSDGLLKMLYMILLHQQFRHPGAPKQGPATSPSSMMPCFPPLPPFLNYPLNHLLQYFSTALTHSFSLLQTQPCPHYQIQTSVTSLWRCRHWAASTLEVSTIIHSLTIVALITASDDSVLSVCSVQLTPSYIATNKEVRFSA